MVWLYLIERITLDREPLHHHTASHSLSISMVHSTFGSVLLRIYFKIPCRNVLLPMLEVCCVCSVLAAERITAIVIILRLFSMVHDRMCMDDVFFCVCPSSKHESIIFNILKYVSCC